ncbi:MAG: hypothetical protein ABWX68_14410 [Arthrobacter sp.]|uniref:hypothetical protein n=1 Tax=Arthrobacter sp. TaxID=1667 RepID=UPI00347263E5
MRRPWGPPGPRACRRALGLGLATVVLAAAARVSGRADWPAPVTAVLLAAAVACALALFVRLVLAAARGRRGTGRA